MQNNFVDNIMHNHLRHQASSQQDVIPSEDGLPSPRGIVLCSSYFSYPESSAFGKDVRDRFSEWKIINEMRRLIPQAIMAGEL
jgi:hypothetical protein